MDDVDKANEFNLLHNRFDSTQCSLFSLPLILILPPGWHVFKTSSEDF